MTEQGESGRTEPEGPPPAGEFSWFRVVGFATSIAFVARIAAVVVRQPDSNPAAVLGQFLGGVLFASLGAGVVLLLSGRSTKAATYGYCALLVFNMFGQMTRPPRYSVEDRQAVERFTGEVATLAEEFLAEGDESGSAMLGRLIEAYDRAAAESTGEMAAASRILARVLAEMRDAMLAWECAAREFEALGGVDWSTLRSHSDLAARGNALAAMEQASRGISKVRGESLGRVDRQLELAGVPGRHRRDYLSAMAAAEEGNSRMAKLEVEAVVALRDQFDVLEFHFGRWEVDPDTGMVVFDDDSAVEPFNVAYDQWVEAEEAMYALQRELVEESLRRLRERK